MRYLIIIAVFLLVLFCGAGLFILLYATTRRDRDDLFKPSTTAPSARAIYREKVLKGVQWFESQTFETLHIVSSDGLTLEADLLAPPHPVASVVAFHGFRSWPSREFAEVTRILYEKDIAVLYPYQRSHRKSEGRFITFGVKEKYDCASWARLLAEKYPDTPLYLYGQSMGGATVLMAGKTELPKQVVGVVADSAFNRPADVIINLFRNSYHVPAYPLILFVDFWALLLGHYGLFHNRAGNSMRNDLRYLFIHGDMDDLIPYFMGKSNFDACPSPQKAFLTVQGAGHCACCYKESNAYNNALINFILNINQEEN